MPHLFLNIDSGQPCNGQNGAYVARTYFEKDRSINFAQVPLGRFNHHLESKASMILETAARLGKQLDLKEDYPISKLAAVCVLRLCVGARHLDSEEIVSPPRLERVGSYAISRQGIKSEEVELPKDKEGRKVNIQGIGKAERPVRGLRPIYPLIHLPTTYLEKAKFVVERAILTAPRDLPLARMGYVALHNKPGELETVEQIMILDELK